MTEVPEGPVLSRRRLSATLRRLRDDAGLTQDQVAAAMDWSLSKVIRIEKGTVGISTSDLKALVQHYHIDDAERVTQLVEWARTSRTRPWWSPYRDSLPSPTFESLLGLEAAASRIEAFNAPIIPGLLQTEDYIRYMLKDFPRAVLSADALDVRVDIRLRRQHHVLRRRAKLNAILDEAALRRRVGDASLMKEQLHHILKLSERPEISVSIIPFSAGPYVATGPFTILSFDDDADSDAVYVELFDTDSLLESAHELDVYRRLFQWMRSKALNPKESLELIRRVADEFAP